MRMIRKGLILVLCLLLASATAGAENYVSQQGKIPDQMSYPGNWQATYRQILYNHMGTILGYESRMISFIQNGREYDIPCKPVKLQDLNGDGIPELLFLETYAGGERGDLYIYSSDGSTAKCVLYIPGITWPGYDEYLGFDIYMSSYGGITLVIEHYEHEYQWALQFSVTGTAGYQLLNWLKCEGDASGEGDDRFYRNREPVSYETYDSILSGCRNGRYNIISGYWKADNSAYGLDLSWQNAIDTLNGTTVPETNNPGKTEEKAPVYGWTIKKLATRKGPGTQYEEGGTYNVKDQYIEVLAKAYDKRNGIWWVKCVIPYHGENRILWTGYQRFDSNTLSLDDLPEEVW